MSKVILRRSDYMYERLKPRIFEIMDAFAGETIKKGARVVIKPNLLAPAAPERAMLTHPSVIKACVEYVVQKGARAQVSDSPAILINLPKLKTHTQMLLTLGVKNLFGCAGLP